MLAILLARECCGRRRKPAVACISRNALCDANLINPAVHPEAGPSVAHAECQHVVGKQESAVSRCAAALHHTVLVDSDLPAGVFIDGEVIPVSG